MARYRLSDPAKADIAAILRREARVRYRACLTAALRRVAADPDGRSTVDHADFAPGVRSFHLRHSRNESREVTVANPVHVIFYRMIQAGMVEIVRVLHDRMEPSRHVAPEVE
jgi:toxin ParE1/3/4